MYIYLRASLVAQMIKNLPAVWETRVQSLGWEDPLEEGMATHSSILAWRIPWTEKPGELQSMRLQRVGHDWAILTGFPGSSVVKNPPCQCRRHGFDAWVDKIPWRKKWQPTHVFLAGKSHGQRSLGELQFMGSQRVRHNLAMERAPIYTYIHNWVTFLYTRT